MQSMAYRMCCFTLTPNHRSKMSAAINISTMQISIILRADTAVKKSQHKRFCVEKKIILEIASKNEIKVQPSPIQRDAYIIRSLTRQQNSYSNNADAFKRCGRRKQAKKRPTTRNNTFTRTTNAQQNATHNKFLAARF